MNILVWFKSRKTIAKANERRRGYLYASEQLVLLGQSVVAKLEEESSGFAQTDFDKGMCDALAYFNVVEEAFRAATVDHAESESTSAINVMPHEPQASVFEATALAMGASRGPTATQINDGIRAMLQCKEDFLTSMSPFVYDEHESTIRRILRTMYLPKPTSLKLTQRQIDRVVAHAGKFAFRFADARESGRYEPSTKAHADLVDFLKTISFSRD